MLDKIIKYGLYLLVFLMPIFFLPWTAFPVDFNKQTLLAVFVFLLLIFWLIKVISSGKISFVWNKLSAAVLLLILALGISAIFSSAGFQSFWGMNVEADTFFNFLLYGLVFFLFSNLISINQLKSVLISVLASSGILALLFLIQAFYKVLPWNFTQVAGFNPIGSVQALAVFLGGAFVILMASLISINQPESASISGKTILKRLTSILPVVLGILLFACIFIINYWVVWLGIVFGLSIILLAMLKRVSANQPESAEISDTRKFILPMIILVMALMLIFVRVPTANILSLPSEISVTQPASFDIANQTLQESPKNLILGAGPATFAYQYNLHRGTGINLTDFWQIRFSQGSAVLPTLLATTGILGILAILFLIVIFFWQGLKSLRIGEVKPQQLVVFVGGAYFLLLWFFYSANFSLMFTGFLMLGLWIGSTVKAREFSFTESPQKAFMIMLLGLFMIAGSVFGIYVMSQKYAAAVNYSQGLNLINAEEPKLDEGIAKISRTVQLDPKDIYFRNLSQAFLIKINQVLNDDDLSQEEKQEIFQQIVSNAEMSANAAVQVNPKNSQNWFQSAIVYENLFILGVEGAEQMAVLNYQKTAELEPKNPQIPLNLGLLYKLAADRSEDEEIKEQNFELALTEFKKSIELKNNFAPAYFLTAQIYEARDEKDQALENYEIVLYLEPNNEEIIKKIEELSR